MGFSIKIAPGVRVRASCRGVRISLGPRVARVHVGAGRTGVSTGIGPVGYYTSVGGPQALADKAAEAPRLQAAFDAIAALHREAFSPAQPPTVPPPPEAPAKLL
jgi:hypothetical protein